MKRIFKKEKWFPNKTKTNRDVIRAQCCVKLKVAKCKGTRNKRVGEPLSQHLIYGQLTWC